ncbi:type II toxin-antitoxin system Phd/YefM family antitoxin [Nesterenkonia muleiensis]|uniref:type II toxin-antitoxin system Phd/YefM family antitoxin n=1 Tax=Nesterenkonia muleiensis TaxID=2282648 RepID=UPI0013001CE6|nr:type II toxin-antitoxin system Phd/YefM family antitoxin [Nesterenkonia muleiensis]
MATVTAAEFNRSPSTVKREAREHPVIVTERDRPSIVVLSYSEYQKLQGTPEKLGTWLQGEGDGLDEFLPSRDDHPRPIPFQDED